MSAVRSRASLCDQCANRDSAKVSELQAVWRDAGLPPFRHIWCKATDRPEDERWHTCPQFEEIGGSR